MKNITLMMHSVVKQKLVPMQFLYWLVARVRMLFHFVEDSDRQILMVTIIIVQHYT